jgi:hypothetical protein
MHEAKSHDHNCFITLTYSDDHLPADRSLDYVHWQKFFKRFRRRVTPRNPHPKGSPERAAFQREHGIRFYMCGEYGERLGRPHYHACIFNYDFPDKRLWKLSETGEKLYRSDLLEELWKYGFSSIGTCTFQSAAYVARYIMKKRTGEDAKDHYHWTDDSGVRHYKLPEFTEMSRRPGIGSYWFDSFAGDVYPADEVIINGKSCRPPRYYDNRLKARDVGLYEETKARRKANAAKHADNNTPERLAVREKVHNAKLARLRKSL